MTGYMEQYLESVETLPSQLKRNFSLMRELDIQAESESRQVEEKCRAFLKEMTRTTQKERKDRLDKIQAGFRNTVEIGDRKVSLAIEIYETVDAHIRKLDENLSQFDSENADSPEKKKRKKGEDGGGYKKKRESIRRDPVEDMPVDPNEPTYCLCHQVSYGEMIACDNEDCPTEWFHFGCVNLTEQPKNKWYCPRCQMEMDRKRR
eukprot:m.339403 g.339403  ORF g.339403 m.339403 type:complete len:205 (-) comp18792_c0_seq1:202-816(-)